MYPKREGKLGEQETRLTRPDMKGLTELIKIYSVGSRDSLGDFEVPGIIMMGGRKIS